MYTRGRVLGLEDAAARREQRGAAANYRYSTSNSSPTMKFIKTLALRFLASLRRYRGIAPHNRVKSVFDVVSSGLVRPRLP
jgi:hypothetical protein